MTSWIAILALALAGLWTVEIALLLVGYRVNCRSDGARSASPRT
jgi:hypothetical protein